MSLKYRRYFLITVYLRLLVEEFIPEQNTTQTIRLIHG